MNQRVLPSAFAIAILIALVAYDFQSTIAAGGSMRQARIVTVAQSGPADFIGASNVALQNAVDSLQRGDTLEIGPGTYEMDNSLFIPSGVSVRGTPDRTILRKSPGVESQLVEDGDYGESELRILEPEKFRSGMGITVTDKLLDSDWDVSVTTIQSIEGNLLRINPMTLRDYSAENQQAAVRNSFPILCAIETDGVLIDSLIVDGNKAENAYIDGCRGGAIYLYRSKDAIVRNCVARNYNGDGISFQITDNIQVINCECHSNPGHGIHPGAGSTHSTVKDCNLHDNGQVGIFLCWRVRNGHFDDNLIENNGEYGVSIGHKDTDNSFVNNTISGNGIAGVHFRKETLKNGGHRNSFTRNKVLNNGGETVGHGFYIEPPTGDLVISNNQIMDTRSDKERTQRYGIYKAKGVGNVIMEDNEFEGQVEMNIFEANQEH